MTDPRMTLTLKDCLVETPFVKAERADRERRRLAWEASLAAAAPVEPEASRQPAPALAVPVASHPVSVGTAKAAGYTGSSCGHCGSMSMRQAGKCELCDKCGESSGGCS